MGEEQITDPEAKTDPAPVHRVVMRLRSSGDTEAADLIVQLQDMLFDATCYSDSYGVPGSDWTVCGLCDAEDDPGLLARGVPHEMTCPCYGSTSQRIESA